MDETLPPIPLEPSSTAVEQPVATPTLLQPLTKRYKLPATRPAFTQKNACGAYEIYVTVGFHDDQTMHPAEVFVHIGKEGSTLAGMCNALSKTISVALQFGVPWESLRDKYDGAQFEPCGPSLDGKQQYTSLVHAIGDTVDQIIKHRKALWGEVETKAS